MARIRLIAWHNGRGLERDLALLGAALQAAGHDVCVSEAPPPRRSGIRSALAEFARRLLAWLRSGGREPIRDDLAITLEHVQRAWLPLARRNAFLPNPEWLSRRDRRHLHRYDAILAKTAIAAVTLRGMGLRTLRVGFHSPDRLDPSVVRRTAFLHVAGGSRMKGTDRLLELWRAHPEWPTLCVLQAPGANPGPPASNLDHRIGHVDDDTLRQLQNAHAFHLCPSRTEGWGHVLGEALGCGAVVLTCDAAPMNELVTPARGLLVASHPAEKLNAAVCHGFDRAAMEAAVGDAIALDADQRRALGDAARSWFEANGAAFRRRLQSAVARLLADAPPGAGDDLG